MTITITDEIEKKSLLIGYKTFIYKRSLKAFAKKSGYGDDGGLQTYDDVQGSKVVEPSAPKQGQGKKEENINENLNKGEEVDFNK